MVEGQPEQADSLEPNWKMHTVTYNKTTHPDLTWASHFMDVITSTGTSLLSYSTPNINQSLQKQMLAKCYVQLYQRHLMIHSNS